MDLDTYVVSEEDLREAVTGHRSVVEAAESMGLTREGTIKEDRAKRRAANAVRYRQRVDTVLGRTKKKKSKKKAEVKPAKKKVQRRRLEEKSEKGLGF